MAPRQKPSVGACQTSIRFDSLSISWTSSSSFPLPRCHQLQFGHSDFSFLWHWGSTVCWENRGPLHIPRVPQNHSPHKYVSGFTPTQKAQPNRPSDLQIPPRHILLPPKPPQSHPTHHFPRVSLHLSLAISRFSHPITLEFHLTGQFKPYWTLSLAQPPHQLERDDLLLRWSTDPPSWHPSVHWCCSFRRFGDFYNGRWFAAERPLELACKCQVSSSTLFKFYPIIDTAILWGHKLSHKSIHIHSDNLAVIDNLQSPIHSFRSRRSQTCSRAKADPLPKLPHNTASKSKKHKQASSLTCQSIFP